MASASGQTYVRQALAPTLHPLWVGGRDCFSRHHVLLFAVSSLLNLFDDRSSTPVPWCCMPRTLQQVYSRGCSLVCRHPDECEVSVADRFCFVYCLKVLAGRESGADYRERVAQRYPPTCVSVSCVMASRKPKGIDDTDHWWYPPDMSPWLGTATGTEQ
jgi:hypothetical protein